MYVRFVLLFSEFTVVSFLLMTSLVVFLFLCQRNADAS